MSAYRNRQRETLADILVTPLKQQIVEDLIVNGTPGTGDSMSTILTRLGRDSSRAAGSQYRTFLWLESAGVVEDVDSEDKNVDDQRVAHHYTLTPEAVEEYADYCDQRVEELLGVLDALKTQFGIDKGYPSLDDK